jgi:phosphate transport system substrate-binding protein
MNKLFLFLFLFALSLNAQPLKIKGSDTVLPLSQKQAESYNKTAMNKVSVTGGGSGVGISSLMDGTTDLAASSRKMKMDEKVKMQNSGKKSKEVIIAFDALSVIVHPSNPVNQLTREQIEGIFTGKIKNWKAVGGEDAKIVLYSRETSSGTYEFFKDFVLKRKNFASSVLAMPASGSIVQSVSQTKGAIGYVGMAYVDKSTKALKVSYDKGVTYVAPSLQTSKNKTYPIIRPLYYYYKSALESKVKSFVDFCLSAAGQSLVEKVGYVSIK